MRHTRSALAAALVLAAAAAARAEDKIVFREGGDVRGLVESQDEETVVIRIGAERRHYPRKLILHVDLDPALHPKAEAPAAEPRPAAPAPKPAAPAPAAGPTAAKKPAPAAPAPILPADAPGVDRQALRALELGTVEEHVAAMNAVADALPTSLPTFKAMVGHGAEPVRLAACTMLSERKLADPLPYVTHLLADNSPVVRRNAVRLVRTLMLRSLESTVLARVSDVDRGVRTEALRSLEDVGTAESAMSLVESWFLEEDKVLKPRFLKLMKKLLATDCGDDVDQWRDAAIRARDRAAVPAPAPKPAK